MLGHSNITGGLRAAIVLGTAIIVTTPAVAAPGKGAPTVHRASMPPAMRAGIQRPAQDLALSQGRGQLINLPAAISDVFVANEQIADVQVKSATQIYLFGKGAGETSVYATTRSGEVVYSANVRVGKNIANVSDMLAAAMPEAQIVATPMNGMVLLTGTVTGPDDAAEAERLTQAYVGTETQVVSRLRSATPLQVMLKVQIAEVSRSLVKEIGNNITSRDQGGTNGFGGYVGVGRNFGTITAGGNIEFQRKGTGGTLGIIGRLFGLDMASALDLAETDGFATILAQPNLTAVSGETASFLAGGEIPIPLSTGLGQVSVEYKQYGVSLAFTPTVLGDGRISMRVKPEVSELSAQGSVTLNGYTIPGILTRRTETTVELGSGQSMMIGGLLSNSSSNSLEKVPGAGDIPILGALFRSTAYRRAQTELMIVVTPYLVKPVTANAIKLPTDGYRAPTVGEQVLMGQTFSGGGGPRPVPTAAPATTVPAAPKGSPVAPGFSN